MGSATLTPDAPGFEKPGLVPFNDACFMLANAPLLSLFVGFQPVADVEAEKLALVERRVFISFDTQVGSIPFMLGSSR